MALGRQQYKYEVVVELGGRPNIDGVFTEESAAIERAKYLLTLAKYTVVRVVKTDARGKEDTLFEKAIAGGGKVTTISHIDEAAFCENALQVYAPAARMTLLRLFRAYFDEQGAIPAEQLHRYFPLRYFEREATLFNPGFSRLATLQAPAAGLTPFQRQDQLSRMFHQIKDYAQNSGVLAPYFEALMRGGVHALMTRMRDERPVEEHDRVLTYAFSVALEPARDWSEKLGGVLRHFVEGDPDAERVVDELACEIIDGREPIKALIGYAPDLGSALTSLLGAMRGELDDRLPHTDRLLDLSNAVAAGSFPRVKEALIRRVRGGIEGKNPLTRTGEEIQAFNTILPRLTHFNGFLGGPEMAEALMKRAKIVWASSHGDLPFEDSVHRLMGFAGGPAARIGFVLDLAASEFGRKRISYLVEEVAHIFNSVRDANDLAPPGVTIAEMREGFGHKLRAIGIPRALADALIAKISSIPDAVSSPSVTLSTKTTVDLAAPPKASEPRLVLKFKGRRHVLVDEGDQLVIGRSRECQVMVDVASASRRHAVVTRSEGSFQLSDLGRNGTFVSHEGGPAQLVGVGNEVTLATRGEIIVGSVDAGEEPAHIAWEVRV